MIGVILNGGKSKRFGEDKSKYLLQAKPMIEHVFERLSRVFDQVILVGKPYKEMKFIEDHYTAGPLGGVLTALEILDDHVFVVGCDMPLIMPEVLRSMCQLFEKQDIDALVPKLADGLHPLHAIYNKRIQENLRWSMRIADNSFRAAFNRSRVLYLEEDFFEKISNWRQSFINVNTKSDLISLEVTVCSERSTR